MEGNSCLVGGFLVQNCERGGGGHTGEGTKVFLDFPTSGGVECGMLSTYPFAQKSLAVHLNGFHGKVNEKVGLQGWHGNGNAHVLANFCLGACLAPDADFVQTAVPPLVGVGLTELQVAKGGKS